MSVIKNKYTKRYSKNLWVEFDPNDPDTPVVVYYQTKQHGLESATYCCAHVEGEIEGHVLTQAQYDWLNSFQNEAIEFYEKYRIIEDN